MKDGIPLQVRTVPRPGTLDRGHLVRQIATSILRRTGARPPRDEDGGLGGEGGTAYPPPDMPPITPPEVP